MKETVKTSKQKNRTRKFKFSIKNYSKDLPKKLKSQKFRAKKVKYKKNSIILLSTG